MRIGVGLANDPERVGIRQQTIEGFDEASALQVLLGQRCDTERYAVPGDGRLLGEVDAREDRTAGRIDP